MESTADILEKVGIARGTLYYHFKSKEDIMDVLMHQKMQKAILKNLTPILADVIQDGIAQYLRR